MNNFIEKMKTDKAFAAEYQAFMRKYDSEIMAATKEMGDRLDKINMKAITEFAQSKGMTLSDDKEAKEMLSGVSRNIGKSLDQVILDEIHKAFR